MKAGGLTEPRIACRLLMAAGMMDMAIVLMITKVIGTTFIPDGSPEAVAVLWILLGLAVLFTYWFATELLLGGRTAGRACLGLEPRGAGGAPLSMGALGLRFLLKAGTLGLTGLRLNRLAPYDRAAGVNWHSPLQLPAAAPIESWQLVVQSGAHAGLRARFDALPGFRKGQAIRIGRDQGWADVALPNERQVSGRHCVLMVRDGRLALRDCGTDGQGSRNGTRLDGKAIAPGAWVEVGGADEFLVANVRIRIVRVGQSA